MTKSDICSVQKGPGLSPSLFIVVVMQGESLGVRLQQYYIQILWCRE